MQVKEKKIRVVDLRKKAKGSSNKKKGRPSHNGWKKEMRKVNEEAFKYLWKIPHGFWSKSRFNYNNKCDVLVNNMSETFNSIIIGLRQKPIVIMQEDIRGWIYG